MYTCIHVMPVLIITFTSKDKLDLSPHYNTDTTRIFNSINFYLSALFTSSTIGDLFIPVGSGVFIWLFQQQVL